MIPPEILSRLKQHKHIPVAYFSIDGLAVCSFKAPKKGDKEWHFAFIRKGHSFVIDISQEAIDGQPADISQDAPDGQQSNKTRYVAEKNINGTLDFEVVNGTSAHYSEYPEGAFHAALHFSREGNKSSDFRWVLDFVGDELKIGKKKRLKNKDEPGRPPVTVARIPNSLLYTEEVSDDEVILAPKGIDPNNGRGRRIGRTNTKVGAVMLADADPGEITITGEDIDIPSLQYTPGLIWHIELKNMEDRKTLRAQVATEGETYVYGDFINYYEIIELDNDVQYQLWAPKRPTTKGKAGDCHSITASVGSLLELIE